MERGGRGEWKGKFNLQLHIHTYIHTHVHAFIESIFNMGKHLSALFSDLCPCLSLQRGLCDKTERPMMSKEELRVTHSSHENEQQGTTCGPRGPHWSLSGGRRSEEDSWPQSALCILQGR